MKKLLNYVTIFSLLLSTNAFTQEVIRQDSVSIGKASTATDKSLKFDTANGASNPSLSVEKVSKKLKYSENVFQLGGSSTTDSKSIIFNGDNQSLLYDGTANALKYSGEELSLGGGTNTDKALKFNNGVTPPQIKYNSTTSKLQFSNNAVDFKDIGSGSGGGSSGTQLLDNDSFEDPLTTGWINSGGVFTQQTFANGSEGNLKFARFVASGAGQFFETTLKAIPTFVVGGCQADFKQVNVSANGLFKVDVLDSALNVLATANINQSTWIKLPTLTFLCPTAGTTVKMKVTSLASGTLEVDKAYLGSNQNIVESTCQGTTECETVFSAKGTTTTGVITDENLDWIVGNGTATNGTQITFKTGLFTVAPNCTASPTNTSVSITNISALSASSVFVNTYDTNTPGIPVANQPFTLKCEKAGVDYTKAKPVTAVTNEQSSWFIDANIGGANPTLGSGAVTSYSPFGDASLDMVINTLKGSASAEIPCGGGIASTGSTCSGVAEQVGIAFVPPMAGLYEVCADFTHHNNAITTEFQLISTPNNSTTILEEGGSRIGDSAGTNTYFPHRLCSNFNFTDVSKKTIRLAYEQTAGTTSIILGDRDGSSGQRDIHFTVKNLSFGQNRPILTGDQATTPGAINPVLYSSRISAAGVIANNIGGLLSGNCAGTSPYVCPFTAGKIKNASNCFCTVTGVTQVSCRVEDSTTSSASIRVVTGTPTTATDSYNLFCHGF